MPIAVAPSTPVQRAAPNAIGLAWTKKTAAPLPAPFNYDKPHAGSTSAAYPPAHAANTRPCRRC